MARPRLTRALTLALGAAYVVAGVAGITLAAHHPDRGPWFWLATLVGGALVLLGIGLVGRQPYVGRGLVCVGSMLGIVATSWTVVVPALALVVVFLHLREIQG